MLAPAGWELKQAPWEPIRPPHVRTNLVFPDLVSFNRYVSDFRKPETRIFSRQGSDRCVVAVMDYHGSSLTSQVTGELANWCQHRAVFEPRKAERFKRWESAHKKAMTQTEFALFLEDNLREIAEPPGADLLAIINEFSIEGSLQFSRAQRLENGSVTLSYRNEQNASARGMTVPTRFKLNVPVFEGEGPAAIYARLRYRLDGQGGLKLWFELEDLDAIQDALWGEVLNRVAVGTGIVPLVGMIQDTSGFGK